MNRVDVRGVVRNVGTKVRTCDDNDGHRVRPSTTEEVIGVKPFLRVLAGETLERPPVWLMRQAGRYLPEYRQIRSQANGFLDMCYTPEWAAEVTLQPIRRYGFDAAILFSDILVVPDALGQEVTFVEGEGPKLDPITDSGGLSALSTNWIRQRLEPVFETIDRVKPALPGEVAFIGFAGAPWTVATYMVEGKGSRDYAKVKEWAYRDPAGFGRLMDLLVVGTSDYLIAQIDAGVEAIQLFDTWASVLPEEKFDDLVIEPTRRIVEAVRAVHPDIPIIGFPRGAGPSYPKYLERTGVTALGLDTTVPVEWAAKTLQPLAPVQGNLDPHHLLFGGDGLKQSAERIVQGLSNGPHIFNLGHGIIKETPPEHVSELLSYIRYS